MTMRSPQSGPHLGLVCITASQAIRFRTITRKRLLQFSPEQQIPLLRELYRENLQRLAAAIQYCQQEQIRLYRLISKLFPFADDPLGAAVLSEFVAELGQIGQRAIAAGIRLVLHPDQFVVLNSDRPEVIQTSRTILEMHARLFDYLEQPRSQWAAINIHGGKGDRADRLVQSIRDLPEAVRSRLTLENDEYTYGIQDLLPICKVAQVALLFDAHHHVIHEKLDSYEDDSIAWALQAARQTWQNPAWQLVHISNGRDTFRDPQHSDYITAMPSAYASIPWIEVEAKLKEQAIARLRQEWVLPAASQPE